jgi:RimJ/RimL family protein N-acetyltransferase
MNAAAPNHFVDWLVHSLAVSINGNERATYVAVAPDDLELLFRVRNDPELRSSLPNGPIGETREQLLRALETRDPMLATTFVIRSRETNDAVGICAITAARGAHPPEMLQDMTIQVLPEFHRQGYGVDALRTMEHAWYCATKRPCFSTTLESNVASRRMLESCGYQQLNRRLRDSLGQPGLLYFKAPPAAA